MSVLLAYVHAPLTPRHPDHRQHHRQHHASRSRQIGTATGRSHRHRFSNSSAFTDFTRRQLREATGAWNWMATLESTWNHAGCVST